MSAKKGFTLIELLVTVAIISMLLGLLMPTLGRSRLIAQQRVAQTQVRGSMMLARHYAEKNKGWMAGLTPLGKMLDAPYEGARYKAGDDAPATLQDVKTLGDTIFAVLLEECEAPPETLLCPVESATALAAEPGVAAPQDVEPNNYSVAVPNLHESDLLLGWKESQAVTDTLIMAERCIDPSDPAAFSSLWTADKSGTWHGAMAFGDGHSEFAVSVARSTLRYGNSASPVDSVFGTGKDGVFSADSRVTGRLWHDLETRD